MKVLVLMLVASAAVSQGAKLEGFPIGRLLDGYSYDPPVAPSVPSGLYELPGPPPPPIIPDRKPTLSSTTTPRKTTPRKTTPRRTTPRRTTPRRTTTTTAAPPPPELLYEVPEVDPSGDSANRFDQFVTPNRPLDTPELPVSQPTPSRLSTPSGFSVPPADDTKKMMGPYMPYEINWGVQDGENGNMFSHSEVSEGNDVRGEYRVLLPDGRTQVVSFYADPESGYNAEVTYV